MLLLLPGVYLLIWASCFAHRIHTHNIKVLVRRSIRIGFIIISKGWVVYYNSVWHPRDRPTTYLCALMMMVSSSVPTFGGAYQRCHRTIGQSEEPLTRTCSQIYDVVGEEFIRTVCEREISESQSKSHTNTQMFLGSAHFQY